MSRGLLAWSRRRLTVVIFLASGFALGWFFSPGLSGLWGRRAKPEADGKTLFEHAWAPNDPLADGDGLGPVFNARSCVACHFQGGVGGAGTNQCNVLAFEVLPTRRDPQVRTGVVHNFAISASLKETQEGLSKRYPPEPRATRVINGVNFTPGPFDPVRTESINTPALFGTGWIDRISGKSIQDNHRQHPAATLARERRSRGPTAPAGRVRLLPDGRVGKFGWKAQFATLEEFVAGACANELGLGNPLTPQAKPLGEPGYRAGKPDLDRQQFATLCGFVDKLSRPVEILPVQEPERLGAVRGKGLFRRIGCAGCHTPDLGGVQGVYSDFLLHRVTPVQGGGYCGHDEPEVPIPADHPLPNEWKTPPLWGVADSAPYFHDGGCDTLKGAILRHQEEAVQVTRAYLELSAVDQEAVLAFLATLKAPPDAAPAQGPGAELRTPGLPQRPPDCPVIGNDW